MIRDVVVFVHFVLLLLPIGVALSLDVGLLSGYLLVSAIVVDELVDAEVNFI